MSKNKKDHQDLFVVVNSPVEIRKGILESSREMIQSLQRYEKFKMIRADKHHEIAKMRELTKDIVKDIAKLRNMLPKDVKPKHVKKPVVKKVVKTPVKKKPVPPPKPKRKTELDKLEDELKDIESKLGSLG